MASGTTVMKRKRNGFNMSYKRLQSMKMGFLYPAGWKHVNPGDIFTHKSFAFVRTQPMFAPTFGRVFVEMFTFFVPYRLIWDEFEDFITGGPAGTSVPAVPWRQSASPVIGSLWDYIGVPPTASHPVSMLPIRAYNEIVNNYFLDPDLQTPLVQDYTSGEDTTSNILLQKACWRKDYFTSARPWPQKGPDVMMPLGDSAPVILDPDTVGDPQEVRLASDHSLFPNSDVHSDGSSHLDNSPGGENIVLDPAGTLIADLSSATSATIRAWRLASAIQRYRENMAISGSKIWERLAQLGVRSADSRLQRPELMNRSKGLLQFSEVLQTAEGTDPVGTMRGHGIGGSKGRGYRRHFSEWGIVMTLICVRPEAIYPDGIDRHLMYATKEDFWTPELEAVGQQEIWKSEVFGGNATPMKETWGYQDRYDEDRRSESTIHGEFRDTLDYWHLGRAFASLPSLNSDFVACTPDEDRIFPAPTEDTLYVIVAHKLKKRALISGAAKRQLL